MNNRDEITAARKKRRRIYRLRRLYAFAVTLAAALVLIFFITRINMFTFRDIGDFFSAVFVKGTGYPVMLESTGSVRIIPVANANAVLTDGELVVKGKRGGELLRSAHNYGWPDMRADGSRILLFDRGNRGYSVFNRTGRLFSAESEYSIISGDVASNGTAVILTRAERSTSQLTVLSGGDYTTLFTWFGANGFPLDCGINGGGSKIYVTSLVASDGGLNTLFTVIDVEKREQQAEIQLPGTAMRVFSAGTGYIVVTDKGVWRLNGNIGLESEVGFSKLPIIGISKEGGLLAVAFGDNNQPDINYVRVFSETLEEVLTLEGVGAVDGIYMSPDRLYYLSAGWIYAVGTDGEYIEAFETELRAKEIFIDAGQIYALLPYSIEQPVRTAADDENAPKKIKTEPEPKTETP